MTLRLLASGLGITILVALGCSSVEQEHLNPPPPANSPFLQADGTEGPHENHSEILTWDTVPTPYELLEPIEYTLPTGQTHWYQVVFLPEGGVNWVQARGLAEQKGGYMVSLHSQQENDFAFSLVTDIKYWWKFPHGYMDDGTELFNLSGPLIGGYQPAGSPEPDGGWRWASGEPMTWTNWQHEDLPIGINIPPDNQPNNSNGNQNVLAFGEVDVVAGYWSDVPHLKGTYNTPLPQAFGFIIEYETNPNSEN